MRTKKEKITSVNVCEYIDRAIMNSKYDEALDLVRRFRVSGYTMTGSRIKKEFGIRNNDISLLSYYEAKNPHYVCAGPMKLYLIAQVKKSLTDNT